MFFLKNKKKKRKSQGTLNAKLEAYIKINYVGEETDLMFAAKPMVFAESMVNATEEFDGCVRKVSAKRSKMSSMAMPGMAMPKLSPMREEAVEESDECFEASPCFDAVFDEEHESKLEERMKHLTDTFSEYLMYLIGERNMKNADVYKRAIVDKKVFSKIKNDCDYHPNKLTALCLCVGAMLNLDETKDLLARAGYALSPCDKTDIIFSYFIENEIYDMIEIDIQLEEHGLPCIIG